MRGRALTWLVAIAVAAGCGCGGRAQSRCERVCQREDECARALKRDGVDLDLGECIDECGRLEQEPTLQRFVDVHVKCVDEAPECAQVMECQ